MFFFSRLKSGKVHQNATWEDQKQQGLQQVQHGHEKDRLHALPAIEHGTPWFLR